ncbi:MAG: MotA/TolQ/ExbB proton channel family protein [Limisphaerales bacterium]
MTTELTSMIQKIWESWVAGGWTMIPIALVAFALYASGVRLLMTLTRRSVGRVSDAKIKDWIIDPNQAPKEFGEVLRYTQDDVASLEDAANRFKEVEATRVPEIDRRLASVNVLVGAAPLLGLLGTVLGMLVTFRAIAAGGGKMMDAMARGISEALITTEMGLLVAVPGMVLAYMVRRKRNEYVSLLARLESLTLRHLRIRMHGMTRAFVRPSRGVQKERIAAGLVEAGTPEPTPVTAAETARSPRGTSPWASDVALGDKTAVPSVP